MKDNDKGVITHVVSKFQNKITVIVKTEKEFNASSSFISLFGGKISSYET